MESPSQKKRTRSFTTLEAKIDENGTQYFKLKKFLIVFFVVLMIMCLTIFALTIASFYITDVPSSSDATLTDRSGKTIIRGGYTQHSDWSVRNKRDDEEDLGLVVCNDDLTLGTFTVQGELLLDDALVKFFSIFRPETVVGKIINPIDTVGPPPGSRSEQSEAQKVEEVTPASRSAKRELVWRNSALYGTMQKVSVLDQQQLAVRNFSPRQQQLRHGNDTVFDAAVFAMYGVTITVPSLLSAPYPYNTSLDTYTGCSGWTLIKGFGIAIPLDAYPADEVSRSHLDPGKYRTAYSGSPLTSAEEFSLLGEIMDFFFTIFNKRDLRDSARTVITLDTAFAVAPL